MISEHGGNSLGLDILYDFSANLNPLGMPESVKGALKNSVGEWEKYPDHSCEKLTVKISEALNVEEEKIACGNGAADMIYRIIRSVKPKKCVLTAPAFSEYEKALREIGCEIEYISLLEKNDFRIEASCLELLENGADMLILCSPNNPTGQVIPALLLEKICEKCYRNNIIFLCDECFLELAESGDALSAINFLNEKTVVLNAFTKTYAMAGIRLGYAVFGDRRLAEAVRGNGQFWSVSAPAQIAGIAALDEKNYLDGSRKIIKAEREFLSKNLSDFGIRVFDSVANFLLLKSDIPLYDELLREKILIRSCANFRGLDERYFRVAVRTHDENLALISAVGRIIHG